ncbi:HNH endonuclease [Paenibacillus sp. JNUCC31]|uniref:HNH endonuclease n=1 Tax=Paenibacillus sp. JNUCC-31 TaxID=2777983 RepID=UPI001E606F5D|nr:HNH endonuclease [Paenibacillus sp. JNUCC-31]
MDELTKVLQDRIGYEQLRLYWPYKAQWLEEVRITRQVNEHAKLYVSGVIPEEDGPGILRIQAEGEPIVLRQVDEAGKSVRRLFHGVMTSLKVHLSGGIYRFEIEALSNTYQMDIHIAERAFQNRGWTFGELVRFIMKPYRYSDVIDQVTGNTQLSGLVLQYKETDWMFLRRLASRFGTFLVPEVTAASPKIFFGLPTGRLWKWPQDQSYRVRKELGEMRWYGSEVEEKYVIRSPKGNQGILQYTMDSAETYALGDKVEFPDGRELTVVEAISRLESGLLMTSYRMMLEEQMRTPRCELSDLIGLSLYGEVVRVIQDHVQIKLPMDDGLMMQGASCPYPVAPTYAAEGHSGLYMMPEIGDTVELYFPESLESGAYIRHSVPEGKRSVGGGTDHKVMGHPAGPSVGMSPEEVKVQAGSGLTITLNDQGVVLSSPGNLSIQGGNIALEAGQIQGSSPEAIWLMGGGSSFILDGQADVRAAQIQQEGSNKAPVHVADLPPEPEPPLIPLEQYEAAQAAALAAKTEATVQASTTSMKEASLFGTALAITAMIPIVGALGGAVSAIVQGVGIAAVAAGVISGVPKVGSFKPSALSLLDRLKAGFTQFVQDEQDAKRNLLGKVLTAARELSTATSFPDFIKKLHQQHQEISTFVHQISEPIKKKWVYQQQQANMEKGYRMAYDYEWKIWKPVGENGDSDHAAMQAYEKDKGSLDYATLKQDPHPVEPVQDIYQLQIKAFELGIHPFTGEPVSDSYAQMMITMLKWNQVGMGVQMVVGSMYSGKSMSKSPAMNSATSQMMRNIQNAEAASKKTSVGNGLATAKSFIQKKWEESQRVGIVPGGFLSNHDSKKPSSGTLWKTSGEDGVGSNAGKPPKTAPETPEPTVKPGSTAVPEKPGGSKPNSSNKDKDGSSAKPKDATPKPESSKSNPVNNKTPNEVNTWKPSSTNDKDLSKPKEDTKPLQPKENDAKPKENQEGPEGTGKKTGKLELSDFTEEIMATKPKYARIPEKWYAKGGHISIDEKGVWTYTNKKGVSVSYPNGYPDFSKYYHPDVKPVKIEYAQPKNYPKDYEAANKEAGLSKTSNPSVPEKNKPPEGYTWHHMEDGKTMVLVEKDVHDEFKHMGGQSIVNGTGGD